MRLAFAVPEVHESLASGKLTLTSAARMASHVRREALAPGDVLALLPRIENRSVQEVERVLASLAPETAKSPERLRALDADHTELKLVLDQEALDLLEEAKTLDANPGIATLEIFKRSLRKYVAEKRRQKTGALTAPRQRTTAVAAEDAATPPVNPRSRYVPRPLRRAVWQRAQSACEFVDTKTRKRCSTTRALTLEHHDPFALGGGHTMENLALYCTNHNAHAAQKIFGKHLDHGA